MSVLSDFPLPIRVSQFVKDSVDRILVGRQRWKLVVALRTGGFMARRNNLGNIYLG